jgi:hypothetical protein
MLKYMELGVPMRECALKIGGKTYDTRIHFGISAPSGSGKGSFNQQIQNYSKALGYSCIPITSLYPEQLIGKYIQDPKRPREKIENRGHFDEDCLLFDDKPEIFTGNSLFHNDIRTYLIRALGQYPNNEVSKRLTGDQKKDTVKYSPKFVSCYLIQNQKIPMENLTSGFGRRVPVVRIEPTIEDEKDILRSFVLQEADNKDLIIVAKKIIDAVNSSGDCLHWSFTKDAQKAIAKWTATELMIIRRQGATELADINKYPLRDLLCRCCAIMSAAFEIEKDSKENNIQITKEIVDVISSELTVVVQAQLNHWKNFVCKKEHILNKQDECILRILQKSKAFDSNSAYHGGTKLLNEVMKKTNLSEPTCRVSIKKLRSIKFIEDDRIGKAEQGKDNKKYWLTEAGKAFLS